MALQTISSLATLPDEDLLRYFESLTPRQTTELMRSVAHTHALRTVEQDLSLIETREQRTILNRLYNTLQKKGVGAEQFVQRFKDMHLGLVFTTHPQQIPTQTQEKVVSWYAQVLQTDWGTPWLNTLKNKTARQLSLYRLKTLNLYSRDVQTALSEARLKYSPILNNTNASASVLTRLRQEAVTRYPELLDANSDLFKNQLYHPMTWLAIDNDRGKVTPEEAMVVAKEKAQIAAREHRKNLLKLLKVAPKEDIQEIYRLLSGLDAYALEHDLKIKAWWNPSFLSPQNALSAEEIESALHTLQSKAKAGSKYFWLLDTVRNKSAILSTHLAAGEARQSGEVLNDIITALFRSKNLDYATATDVEKLRFLRDHLKAPSNIDFEALDYSFLSPEQQKEVKKYLKWHDFYKTVRQKFGASAIQQVVLANSESPLQAGFMRLIAESKGLPTTGKDALQFCTLVESADEQKFFQTLSGFIDNRPNITELLFPNGVNVMQACSDTSRVDGLSMAWHRYLSLGYTLQKYQRITYPGTGAGWQRFGFNFPDQTIENAPDNILRLKTTQQGDAVHRFFRTLRGAKAHMEHTFATFLARSFGIGNDIDPHLSRTILRDLAHDAHQTMLQRITHNPAINIILQDMTGLPYHGALNPGSRGASGFPQTLTAFLSKLPTHESSRAISLSFQSMLSGMHYAGLYGEVLENWAKQSGNSVDTLHTLYQQNRHFRKFISTTLRGMPMADVSLLKAAFPEKLSQNGVQELIDFMQDDARKLKALLPQIIEGSGTQKSWQDLLTRADHDAIRVTRAAFFANLKKVQALGAAEPLFKKLGGLRLPTRAGRTFTAMMNAMAAFSNVIRSGG